MESSITLYLNRMRIGVSSGFMRFYHQVGVVVVAAQQLEANVVTFPHPERRYDFTFLRFWPSSGQFCRFTWESGSRWRQRERGPHPPPHSPHIHHFIRTNLYLPPKIACKAGTKLRAPNVSLHSSRPNILVLTIQASLCDKTIQSHNCLQNANRRTGLENAISFTCDSCVLTIKETEKDKKDRPKNSEMIGVPT